MTTGELSVGPSLGHVLSFLFFVCVVCLASPLGRVVVSVSLRRRRGSSSCLPAIPSVSRGRGGRLRVSYRQTRERHDIEHIVSVQRNDHRSHKGMRISIITVISLSLDALVLIIIRPPHTLWSSSWTRHVLRSMTTTTTRPPSLLSAYAGCYIHHAITSHNPS